MFNRYAVCEFGALSWLWWLVASLWLQRPGFSPSPVHVGFCGGHTCARKGYCPRTSLFLCHYHFVSVSDWFICPSSTIHNFSNWQHC